eukprot:g23401.t1
MDANKRSDTFPVPEPAPKGHIDPSAEEFEMFELLQRRLPAVIVLVDQLQILPGRTALLYNSEAVDSSTFNRMWGGLCENLVPVAGWDKININNGGDQLSFWNSWECYENDHKEHGKTFLTVDIPGDIDNDVASIHLRDLGNQGSWILSQQGITKPTGNLIGASAEGDIGGPQCGCCPGIMTVAPESTRFAPQTIPPELQNLHEAESWIVPGNALEKGKIKVSSFKIFNVPSNQFNELSYGEAYASMVREGTLRRSCEETRSCCMHSKLSQDE